jgi:hypothetical protein
MRHGWGGRLVRVEQTQGYEGFQRALNRIPGREPPLLQPVQAP